MKKFAIIFGTRPEYLKLKSLMDTFKNSNLVFKVIFIRQHEKIEEILDDNIEEILIINYTPNRLMNIGSEILIKLPKVILDCTDIIIQGDTATAFYSALTAFQMQKQIIHIEAGLRTYDLQNPFPEEAYRQMISRITNFHFTPHIDSLNTLEDEKVLGNKYVVGNTILDLIKSYNLKCKNDNTVLITFHRRENWDKIDKLLEGLKSLISKTPHLKYIWYLHVNPELQKKVKNELHNLNINQIELKEPCNHKEFTIQIAKATFLITDSGGIQEEASFLGKHCIVLRETTERSHIPKDYITLLNDFSQLGKLYGKIPKELSPCTVYGNGNSCQLIMDILLSDNY
jgi:UDP-N-acetylglucosamine 2-epimerase (non-hydrolysing)